MQTMKKTKEILKEIEDMGGVALIAKCDIEDAVIEIKAAEAEIVGLKKELAELKERAAQDAINSLRGNTGGEYNG